MNIEKLLKRQEGIVDDMTKALKKRGFDSSQLERPIAIHEERIAAIQSRIDAIEQFKRKQVVQAEEQVKALKGEIKLLENEIKNTRAMVDPVIKSSKTKTAEKPSLKPEAKGPSKRSK